MFKILSQVSGKGGTGSESESLLQPETLPERYESGTLNTHGLAGLSAGLHFILERGIEQIEKRETELINRLINGISEINGIRLIGEKGQKCGSVVGDKIYGKRPGKREKRTNIIAGLLYGKHEKKHIAVRCYEQTTTARLFEDWFEFELIPLLPENTIIVMDNASFHRKNVLWNIAERYDVFVLLLSPYSPEFNPIEHSWANFKEWLKYNSERSPCFDWAVDTYFT